MAKFRTGQRVRHKTGNWKGTVAAEGRGRDVHLVHVTRDGEHAQMSFWAHELVKLHRHEWEEDTTAPDTGAGAEWHFDCHGCGKHKYEWVDAAGERHVEVTEAGEDSFFRNDDDTTDRDSFFRNDDRD